MCYVRVAASGEPPKLCLMRHEPGAAFAADGAARLGGVPAVVLVTWGVGGLNVVNALAGSFVEKVGTCSYPVVKVRPSLFFHGCSQAPSHLLEDSSFWTICVGYGYEIRRYESTKDGY